MPGISKAGPESRSGFREIKRITADTDPLYTQLTLDEHIVHVTTGATSDHNVHLPDVAEAHGMMYSIKIVSDGGQDVLPYTSYGLETPVAVGDTIVGIDGYLHVLSNGEDWITLSGSAGT
jgi:hypothetical protein